LQIYPNPTSTTITIEAGGLREGDYLLQLIAVNGTVQLHADVHLSTGENLHHTLDVERTPSGYYVVRIERAARGEATGDVIGTYPIIITR
jgi:hypothetical protein